jgi:hypothetical protein
LQARLVTQPLILKYDLLVSIFWFQAFDFKWVNLYCYSVGPTTVSDPAMINRMQHGTQTSASNMDIKSRMVGLNPKQPQTALKLNAVDPWAIPGLVTQPLSL